MRGGRLGRATRAVLRCAKLGMFRRRTRSRLVSPRCGGTQRHEARAGWYSRCRLYSGLYYFHRRVRLFNLRIVAD